MTYLDPSPSAPALRHNLESRLRSVSSEISRAAAEIVSKIKEFITAYDTLARAAGMKYGAGAKTQLPGMEREINLWNHLLSELGYEKISFTPTAPRPPERETRVSPPLPRRQPASSDSSPRSDSRTNITASQAQEKRFVKDPFNSDGALKPSVRYKAGEHGYDYETDSNGRLSNFHTDKLRLTHREKRLPHEGDSPGKKEGDHAGHLAADQFGGSEKLDNIVSQSQKVNLSRYRSIERAWAAAIKEGKNVSVDVDVIYKSAGARPRGFVVDYAIDGDVHGTCLLNV
jgi:hypothetical protein